jgi:cation/acetate symporter
MTAIIIFGGFVVFLFWLSWYLGRKSQSEDGFFVAGGQIHWFVNGIALTGGYLSAASFLGICGMIAFKGFDGFLYSIGFLSGWVVALFVVAEPMRRLGKYTFADALESRFKSRTIHLAAGISTLVVSMCYLVPQMVGAGVLIEPLLGIPYHWGVIIVGAVVIVIVASAGMSSTTYVQFIKAGMLITFSIVLVGAVLMRGIDTTPENVNIRGESADRSLLRTIPYNTEQTIDQNFSETGCSFIEKKGDWVLVKDFKTQNEGWWKIDSDRNGAPVFRETQNITKTLQGDVFVNGNPADKENVLYAMGRISKFGERTGHTGKRGLVGPFRFLSVLADPGTEFEIPVSTSLQHGSNNVKLFYHKTVPGNELMRPGGNFDIAKGSTWGRLNFISLMLALFFGTAALPHVLIRYYTVKDSTAARKSTVVAIASIGLFYILTLFLGLGAVVNGVLNPLSDNMSAPLLARSFGEILFAIVTALAFATVLGTVSGLIVAASGAVANDLMDKFFQRKMVGKTKVIAAKTTAITVGILSVILGIMFRGVNVGFLVGLAFAVAASANFPAIIMVLFWKHTTSKGIIASILVGTFVSMGIILMGPEMFQLYGYTKADAWIPIGQPAIIAMPLSFITLIVVSLFTKNGKEKGEPIASI